MHGRFEFKAQLPGREEAKHQTSGGALSIRCALFTVPNMEGTRCE